MEKRKQSFLPAIAVIAIMIVLIGAYVIGAYRYIKPADGEICQGVFIDEVDVSGMSGEEAQAALDAHVDKLAARSLEVDVNGETVTTTLAEIGYACETEKAIEEAMQVGKEGNMFSNYAEIKKVAAEHKVFPLSFSYSEKN